MKKKKEKPVMKTVMLPNFLCKSQNCLNFTRIKPNAGV